MQIHKDTKIGHVHLKVSDLKKSEEFYTKILGFEVTARIGDSAVFLSAGGYHHHIGLNTWESKGGTPPPTGYTGLFHFAILLPSRLELAKVLKNILEHNYTFDGAADHDVSEAIYLQDPDGIGIELYCDRDEKEWVREGDSIKMGTRGLDLQGLLGELEK
jgi:catechol 2,3-dioxygenase